MVSPDAYAGASISEKIPATFNDAADGASTILIKLYEGTTQ
jgi:hypothetical protein